MITGFDCAVNSLVPVETQIQALLNDADVPTIQYPFYLNFGRELWAKIRKGIDGPTLAAVGQSLHDKYVGYGMETATLVDIADQVLNITVS